MNPLTSILDLFSTFAYLEGDDFRWWVISMRDCDGISRCVYPQLPIELRACGRYRSLYWFQQWQSQSSPVAEPHLLDPVAIGRLG
jgi:hypothetical protein